jgi:hydroxymethylbilane synthase
VRAERSFLACLQGGCQVPIGAWATVDAGQLCLRGMISDTDGRTLLRGERWGMVHAPEQVGVALAEELLHRGGEAILRDIYGATPRSGLEKSR